MVKLVISKIQFDPEAIAAALRITKEQAVSALQDGRGAWPFSEFWGERLYEFIKHSNTNQPFSDGAVALKQLRDMSVSVKSLTRRGIKFQQSKSVGSGRKTDKSGLIISIEACDRIVVVDITEFPLVSFLPIDSARLVGAAHKDELTLGGWSKARFYAWVQKVYQVTEVTLTI